MSIHESVEAIMLTTVVLQASWTCAGSGRTGAQEFLMVWICEYATAILLTTTVLQDALVRELVPDN